VLDSWVGPLAWRCVTGVLAGEVHGYVRRPETLEAVRKAQAVDTVSMDLAEVLSGAEMVVLCTPLSHMEPLVVQFPGLLARGAVVTDVGSVKTGVVASLEGAVAAAGGSFVGSHPMAGSERSGVEAARSDLFEGAVSVVTPTFTGDAGAGIQVVQLWEALGSRVVTLAPELHDELVSRSSHLPPLGGGDACPVHPVALPPRGAAPTLRNRLPRLHPHSFGISRHVARYRPGESGGHPGRLGRISARARRVAGRIGKIRRRGHRGVPQCRQGTAGRLGGAKVESREANRIPGAASRDLIHGIINILNERTQLPLVSLPSLIEIQPLAAPLAGPVTVTVPGSKSLTNRALVLAALGRGTTTLRGALWSEDTQVMTDCLRRLGFEVAVDYDPEEEANRSIKVRGLGGLIPRGGTAEAPLELRVGNAGTAARFLAAMVCLGTGVYRLSGVPRMHERPQAELFGTLRAMGYRVDSSNDRLPAGDPWNRPTPSPRPGERRCQFAVRLGALAVGAHGRLGH
jgi:hypothetical protein